MHWGYVRVIRLPSYQTAISGRKNCSLYFFLFVSYFFVPGLAGRALRFSLVSVPITFQNLYFKKHLCKILHCIKFMLEINEFWCMVCHFVL